MAFRVLVGVLFGLMGIQALVAQEALVEASSEEIQTIQTLEVFADLQGSDQEILAQLPHSQGRFVHYGQKIVKPFHGVWLGFRVQNTTSTAIQRVIYLSNNFSEQNLDFFVYRAGQFVEHLSFPVKPGGLEEEIFGRTFFSLLNLPAHSESEIYVKVRNGYEPLTHTLQMGPRQAFINWEVFSIFFIGIYEGILFLTAVANFLQAAAYRDRTFLWYSFYCASLFFFVPSYYGLWNWFWGPSASQQLLIFLGNFVSLVCLIGFIRRLLDTRTIAPVLDRILVGILGLALTALILRSLPSTNYIGFILQGVTSFLYTCAGMTAGVIGIRKKKEFAGLFTLAFLSFAISVNYLRLSLFNIAPPHRLLYYTPSFGMVILILVLSYAMFTRGRSAHREILLSKRNRSVNEKLNLLLKILSHDIANPLQAISLYCNMAKDQLRMGNSPAKELDKALEAVDVQTQIIRHAKEAVRQMQLGQHMKIKPIAVSLVIRDLQQLFEPLCQDRGIALSISNDLKEDLVFDTDPTILVHSIFGNILSNSIKFSPSGSVIKFAVSMQSRRLIFELKDHGPGLSKDKRIEIFALNVGVMGIHNQLAGSGSFGLSILHMCSDLLQGHLDIGPSEISASGQEMGLRISVSLPLHHAL